MVRLYCRYEGKHGQRQGHLGEARINMALSQATLGEPGDPEARRIKGRQKDWIMEMAALYREGQLGEGQPNSQA